MRVRLNLPQLRWAAALTQAELAERAGLHVSTVNRLEWGGTPSARTTRKIADALGVPADALIQIVPDAPQPVAITNALSKTQAILDQLATRIEALA